MQGSLLRCSLLKYSLLKSSIIFSLVLYCGFCATLVTAQTDYSQRNVRDTVHINRCGNCHLAYSPGLLPVQSWQGIMAGLEDHFGNKVALTTENSTHILAYLEKYALAEGQQSVMGQLITGLPDNPPLRITELPAFVALHHVVAEQLELDELETGFLSPCANCHRAAASHIFDKALLQTGHSGGLLSDYK